MTDSETPNGEDLITKDSFSITYSGPAVEEGTMNVRDLGPALVSVGKLFENASKALHGKKPKVRVDLGTTSAGSFELDLILNIDLAQFATDLFIENRDRILRELLRVIISKKSRERIITGLIHLLKKIKGRKVTKIELPKNGVAVIIIDEERLEITERLFQVYTSPSVQKEAEKMVRNPLKHKNGITEFQCTYENETISVSEDEADYFAVVPQDKDEDEEKRAEEFRENVSLKFIVIDFSDDDKKWKFSETNGSIISARIKDQSFLNRIENNEASFRKEDTLVCDIRITVSGDKETHDIERVVDHKRPPTQLEIPDDE